MEIKDFRNKVSLLNSRQIEKILHEKGMWVSGTALEDLNERVIELITKAIIRTKANKRKTVFGRDF